ALPSVFTSCFTAPSAIEYSQIWLPRSVVRLKTRPAEFASHPLGTSSAGDDPTTRSAPLSLGTITASFEPPASRVNAIHFPSGDQRGPESQTPKLTRFGCPPSASAT